MPQYPVRDRSSLEGLSRLANAYANLSFRNDVAQKQHDEGVARRARVMRTGEDLYKSLSDPASDYRVRNAARVRAGLAFQAEGYPVSGGFYDIEKPEKVAPDRLFSVIDKDGNAAVKTAAEINSPGSGYKLQGDVTSARSVKAAGERQTVGEGGKEKKDVLDSVERYEKELERLDLLDNDYAVEVSATGVTDAQKQAVAQAREGIKTQKANYERRIQAQQEAHPEYFEKTSPTPKHEAKGKTISLKAAKMGYGDRLKGRDDAWLKKYLEDNGFTVTE